MIDWLAELRKWRETRQAVVEAHLLEKNECERLNVLLRKHGNLRKDCSVAESSIDTWLQGEVAEAALASNQEDNK